MCDESFYVHVCVMGVRIHACVRGGQKFTSHVLLQVPSFCETASVPGLEFTN